MKFFKIKLGKSIFRRLVVNFLIIIFPIYILGIYIYNWGLHTVKSEIARSTIAQASFYLEGLEKEIERMKILQYDCLNDEYLNKLAIRWDVMDTYNRIECIRQLQQRLVTIKNSSIYISNVRAHIRTIGRTISSNSVSDPINLENFQGVRIPSGIHGAQIISFKGGLYLSTVQQNNSPGNNPLYLLEIELNQEALKQALTQFNTYNGSGSLLVTLMNHSMIMNQSDANTILLPESIVEHMSKEGSSGMKLFKIHRKGYYVVYSKSEYLNIALLRYIPEEYVVKPLQNFYVWAWVFSSAAVCIIVIFSFSTYKFMHKPLLELVKSFRKVESGDLQVSIDHDSSNEFGYLYERFNDMVRNLNMLINQVYNQKLLMQRAELKHLQSQINPHFLYNSFFMLNTMARIGDENLIPFTRQLGEYFRFVTRNSSDYILLQEEVNHAKVYTDIQQTRFSKRLLIQFAECPERYKMLNVPRLILQPIIENAFEYGIEKKKSRGIISVAFEADEKKLDIIVEDNGSDMTDEELEKLQNRLEYNGEELETTGIINIHRRIRLVYGEKSGLRVSRSALGGLKVILYILPGGENYV